MVILFGAAEFQEPSVLGMVVTLCGLHAWRVSMATPANMKQTFLFCTSSTPLATSLPSYWLFLLQTLIMAWCHARPSLTGLPGLGSFFLNAHLGWHNREYLLVLEALCKWLKLSDIQPFHIHTHFTYTHTQHTQLHTHTYHTQHTCSHTQHTVTYNANTTHTHSPPPHTHIPSNTYTHSLVQHTT